MVEQIVGSVAEINTTCARRAMTILADLQNRGMDVAGKPRRHCDPYRRNHHHPRRRPRRPPVADGRAYPSIHRGRGGRLDRRLAATGQTIVSAIENRSAKPKPPWLLAAQRLQTMLEEAGTSFPAASASPPRMRPTPRHQWRYADPRHQRAQRCGSRPNQFRSLPLGEHRRGPDQCLRQDLGRPTGGAEKHSLAIADDLHSRLDDRLSSLEARSLTHAEKVHSTLDNTLSSFDAHSPTAHRPSRQSRKPHGRVRAPLPVAVDPCALRSRSPPRRIRGSFRLNIQTNRSGLDETLKGFEQRLRVIPRKPRPPRQAPWRVRAALWRRHHECAVGVRQPHGRV